MFAIVDVEASGGDPKKDRLTEIAIFIHNGKRVIEQYCTLINPETYISPFITSLTGISNEMVAEAPTFAEIAPKIIELTEGRIFVAHNVRFDYSFVNNEFKRLGMYFIRKQLDTIKLSHRILPGMASYSLGKLCRELGIPMENRHRAFGDGAATAELFDLMLKKEKDSIITEAMKQEIRDNLIPPNLNRDAVNALPEETGVYYFKDEKGKIIYIGKSKNIRDRVMQHFSEDMHSQKHHSIKHKIHSLDYELTGSELVALILESHEIKRWMPEYNRAQRKKKYRYGIYKETDAKGYINFKLKLRDMEEPLIHLNNRRRGTDILAALAEKNDLCLAFCGGENTNLGCPNYIIGKCEGACVGKESPESYNPRAEIAISRFQYQNHNFIISGEGRKPQERSIICIEEGKYIGFGFHEENDSQISSIEDAKIIINALPDDPDIQRIIRSSLRKLAKNTTVISF